MGLQQLKRANLVVAGELTYRAEKFNRLRTLHGDCSIRIAFVMDGNSRRRTLAEAFP